MKLAFKIHFITLAFLLIDFSICEAQFINPFFQNFEIANHKIYVLHADGILKVFDENGKPLEEYARKPRIKILTKDRLNNIVIVDSTNCVKRLDLNNRWTKIFSYSNRMLYGLAFNKTNNLFLITGKGILDVKSKNIYMPEKKFYHSEWAHGTDRGWGSERTHITPYIDNDDNMWFAFDHGEWGRDLFIWNTEKGNFISFTKPIIIPIYESKDHIFSKTSSDLLGINQSLLQFNKVYDEKGNVIDYNISEIYDSENDESLQAAKRSHDKPLNFDHKKGVDLKSYNFYIGPFAFNPIDNKLNILTSEGLFVADRLSKNLKFENLRRIKDFDFPKEVTKAYEYYDDKKEEIEFTINGYPQNVTKLQFNSKGGIVMLLPHYGLWLFDGKILRILE
ncbi:MAG TPA: hypothetical protein VIM89_14825 [Mucilaginibacter sp.]